MSAKRIYPAMPYSGQTRMSDIAFDIHIQKKKTSLFLMFKKSL